MYLRLLREINLGSNVYLLCLKFPDIALYFKHAPTKMPINLDDMRITGYIYIRGIYTEMFRQSILD